MGATKRKAAPAKAPAKASKAKASKAKASKGNGAALDKLSEAGRAAWGKITEGVAATTAAALDSTDAVGSLRPRYLALFVAYIGERCGGMALEARAEAGTDLYHVRAALMETYRVERCRRLGIDPTSEDGKAPHGMRESVSPILSKVLKIVREAPENRIRAVLEADGVGFETLYRELSGKGNDRLSDPEKAGKAMAKAGTAGIGPALAALAESKEAAALVPLVLSGLVATFPDDAKEVRAAVGDWLAVSAEQAGEVAEVDLATAEVVQAE